MSGAELLAEPSCLGTAGISVEACIEIGGVFVVVISMFVSGKLGKLLESVK